MGRLVLEVIVQSVADAREAERGGADRLEVVRDIRYGGLTPSLATVTAIARESRLPLRAMLREHAGFELDDGEVRTLQRDAAALAALGVDGLVLGFTRSGQLSIADMRRVLPDAPRPRVTLHRAFDTLTDAPAAIDRFAALPGADRVLTSGGEGSPGVRCARLREHQSYAGDRLTVIAGGGVTHDMIALMSQSSAVREVHVGRAARDHDDPEGPVSADRVRWLRELAG
jgi:copper homeostasis protein